MVHLAQFDLDQFKGISEDAIFNSGDEETENPIMIE